MPPFPESWGGRRYHSISQAYQKRFGRKVHKLALSVSQSCPNRSSEIGACVFCDEWGSAGIYVRPELSVAAQIAAYKAGMKDRFRTQGFLAYFQPYTNSFTRTKDLEVQLRAALQDPEVLGLIIGTRPDCLNKSLFPLLAELAQETYVCVELGVQSYEDPALAFLNRGHGAAESTEAVLRLKEVPGLEVGVHLIFGLPQEGDPEILFAAQETNRLGVDNVKLHNLHVLKNTPLETLYRQGGFVPLELEEYARRVVLFLEHASPTLAVGRLAAKASREEELVAPAWTAQKMPPINRIEGMLKSQNTWQSRLWTPEARWT